MSFNIPAIRELLLEAFGDEALSVFCADHYSEVKQQFTTGQTKGARIDLLLEHVQQHEGLEDLLTRIKECRPEKYAKFESDLRVPVSEFGPGGSPSPSTPHRRPKECEITKYVPSIANRSYQLCLFNRMLAGHDSKRILLIYGPGGMGKSWLLDEFGHLCPANIRHVRINLSESSTGLHNVFFSMCETIGWNHFRAFVDRIENLGLVRAGHHVALGTAEIEVALRAPDSRGRAERRNDLTRAFCKDVRKLKRKLVLIFDSFDQAPGEIQDWVWDSFLRTAFNISRLITVVAGRELPEQRDAWRARCHRLELGVIQDVDAWHEYNRVQGLQVEPGYIVAFCKGANGNPALIDQLMKNAAGGMGRRL